MQLDISEAMPAWLTSPRNLNTMSPAGEPLTFAEVLATNPDWSEQGPLQSEANGKDSPAGGVAPTKPDYTTPARQLSDKALMEEAVRV